jgi:cytochrome P450
LLGEGEIDGDALVCRNHHWRFALDSGRREGGPECLASCPVDERDGSLFVDVTVLRPIDDRFAAARPLGDLPGPPPLPLIGNLLQLEPTRMHLILEAWAARYGSIYQFRLGPTRIVVTSDSKLIEESLCARPETFRRQAKLDANIRDMGIQGVFNAEGDAWRSQRKLTVAALAQRHLREVYPSIRTVAIRLKSRWGRAAAAGATLDAIEELKRFTIDVTMLVVFGHDVNTVEDSGDVIQRHLSVVFPILNRRLFAIFPIWRHVRTPEERRLQHALKAIRAWFDGLMAQTRARLAEEPERARQPSNFLEAMLTSVDEKGERYSDDVIMSNLITMLLAGEDTTACTLAWAIHEVCDRREWSTHIRREADSAFGADDVADTFETANKLPIANAVASETMRLRPVGPVGFLDANIDTTLGGYFIPKGTSIFLLPRPAVLDPDNFVEPRAFRPERWLGDVAGPNELSLSVPFSLGPRLCPGRSLALIEMKTLLSMLYRNFDVDRVGDSAEVSELFGFAMSPIGLKVRLRFRPRELVNQGQ